MKTSRLPRRSLVAAALAALALVSVGVANADTIRPAQYAQYAQHLTGADRGAAASPNLREGARGDAVKALQRQLVERGYQLDVDGIFGPVTKAAVEDFQRTHRLEADGIVGPRTRAALKDGNGKTTTPRPPAPAASVLRNKIVSVAHGRLTPKGSHPENTGACNEYFAYSTVGHGSCEQTSWCAAFAEWTWHQAGVTSVPDHTLAARGIGKWGKDHGLFHDRTRYTPKPGDLVIYGPPDGNVPGHVGVVVAVHANGAIDTIDGNYSDKVTLRERLSPSKATGNGKHISGYVSPPGA